MVSIKRFNQKTEQQYSLKCMTEFWLPLNIHEVYFTANAAKFNFHQWRFDIVKWQQISQKTPTVSDLDDFLHAENQPKYKKLQFLTTYITKILEENIWHEQNFKLMSFFTLVIKGAISETKLWRIDSPITLSNKTSMKM